MRNRHQKAARKKGVVMRDGRFVLDFCARLGTITMILLVLAPSHGLGADDTAAFSPLCADYSWSYGDTRYVIHPASTGASLWGIAPPGRSVINGEAVIRLYPMIMTVSSLAAFLRVLVLS
jgi:hypothetical protein